MAFAGGVGRWIAAALIVASASCAAWAAATVTFTADDSGTYPRALSYDRTTGELSVDLSGLPRDWTIFRAELVLRPPRRPSERPVQPTAVFPVSLPGRKLRFTGPRFTGLDCLDAVRQAVEAVEPLRLQVETTVGGVRRLEVSCLEAKPTVGDAPVVTGLRVVHRSGQSLITFAEPKLGELPPFSTGEEVARFKARFLKAHPGITFRVWRSSRRITPRAIDAARLVGECGFFTAWNDGYHQNATKKNPPLRYRVEDDGEPVDWGTGIYAHNPDSPGDAYYAVTVAVDGEEDFGKLDRGNSLPAPVRETVGQGEPILQWVEQPDPEKGWHYRRGRMARLIYTRWETWPFASTPNVPIDYLVAIPLDPSPEGSAREPQHRAWRTDPAPVGLHLHCWGGSCNGGYGWWYNAHRGAVLVASNQIPYDWWTGYHEARETHKTWGDGHVRPFTMDRLLGFLDWAAKQWSEAPPKIRSYWPRLDRNRVFAAGSSMGGSGAPMYAIRRPDRIAWALGWVGVHVPELSPQFAGSYRASYGPRHEGITMPDGKTSPWDYFSDVWWLRTNVRAETGFIIASNGRNDGGIGWKQAVAFARALQETRRPHMFNWGMGGHGTRTLIGANFDLDVRSDRTLPAFTNCSLDDEIGDGDPDTGAREGQYNAYLRWRSDDVVDTDGTWEMTIVLDEKAPRSSSAVDVTPRRCQSFSARPGDQFEWRSRALDAGPREITGEIAADQNGLVTIRGLELGRGRNRVIIRRR